MIKLVIEDDEGKATVVPLIRDEISIGRKEGNTIRLTERNVSRRHARLFRNNGAIFIEDLNSYNGIKVNGNRVGGRVAVTEGDRIQIGDYLLGLREEHAASTREGREEPEAEESASMADAQSLSPESDALASSHPAARLVCVSSNFAGLEFELSKPAMVLGRTEDNDLIVDHRSISRHHCRIVEEQGRSTIIDLHSANGVRVNGERYGKVELRRGDLIDLGHVCLRFVAPNEDFVFERDAKIVDTARGTGAGRGLLLVVLLLLVAGAALWLWRDRSADVDPSTGFATDSVQSTVASQDAAIPSPPETLPALELLAQAVERQAWLEAGQVCSKMRASEAPSVGANSARVDRLCATARREQQWQETYDSAEAKAQSSQWVEALELYKRIPESSVYAESRRQSKNYAAARAAYRQQMLALIDSHVARAECEDARRKAAVIKTLLPDEEQAAERAARCRVLAKQRSSRRPRPVRRPRVERPSAKSTSRSKQPTPASLTAEQTSRLLSSARSAYVAGDHARAIRLANQVLQGTLASGGAVQVRRDALQIVGSAACYTRNQSLARSAYRRLDAKRRNLLRLVCARNNIGL